MKKILLIGSGAREHVIGETLHKSGARLFTYAKTRNPGLLDLSEDYETGELNDFEHLKEYARKIAPDFAFIGPDDPIADGVADLFLESNISSVAPLKKAAQIESSKAFARNLLQKYRIHGNPKFRVFLDENGLLDFIAELEENYVVKANGLMGGKGVKVSGEHLKNEQEGFSYAQECLKKAGKVVIEEKLIGQEFSLMAFSDGKSLALMPAVQDHKRAFEGDTGPNTGGMGSYSDANHSLPFLEKEDILKAHEMMKETIRALYEETGCPFKGILYGGFIAVKDGIRLIEFNARFGDPESLNVLPLLKTNFIEVCEAIINGDLPNLKVEFDHKATVCKYIVPEGYPENPQKGQKIEVGAISNGVRRYYASVDQTPEGLLLGSSRALAFVGIADNLEEAEKVAQSACDSIKGPVFYRKDIGTKTLIEKRVEMMKKLRNGV
jgi:phosphoribosylamine--glycine ligase